jgi:hypothetical protein
MKLYCGIYILFFIIFFFISVNNTLACDAICRAKKYAYLGCDQTTNQKKTICTDNPRGIPNFRPYKKCFPMNVTIEPFPEPVPGWYIDVNGDGNPQVNEISFFDQHAQALVFGARDNWSATCTPDNQDCDNCSLNVIWAKRKELMREYPNSLAITFQPPVNATGLPASCQVDCNRSYIAINTQDDFMKKNGNGVPEIFFYTNRNYPGGNLEWYDFQTVIFHEMGHWFGFGDGQEGCNTSYTGVMQTPLDVNTNRNLSEDDRCMFQKLYCCGPNGSTNTDEEDTDNNSVILSNGVYFSPNPFNTNIVVKGIHSEEFASFTLDIMTITGQNVYHAVYEQHSNDISIDTRTLSVGTYMIMLTTHTFPRQYLKAIITKMP